MPNLQAATTLAWGDAARLQGATALAWGDAAGLQSRGSAYVAPGVGGGTVITPGSLAPLRDITAATRYLDTSALSVTDLRDSTALPVTSVSLDLADGSDLWTLQAAGNGALAAALRAGEQPATVQVTLGADTWRFVVEEISQPITFESTDCTFRGRSLAAAAGAPYQAVTSWITDAPTTPAQVAALANTFTGVAVDWGVADWLIPEGAWSASTDPLGVVRQMAASVGAVVEAHRTELKLLVRPRYATAPNTWGTQRPDAQIAWEAIESASQERNDQPEYNGVLVSGTQSGGLLQARLEGTSGSVQAPMVTDPLLTDTVAQIQRAESLLHSYGGRARETRTLQLHGGVVARGALVRCVEPAETWTGVVRAVSVRASLEQARQTITMERPTSFPAGTAVAPPPSVVCGPVTVPPTPILPITGQSPAVIYDAGTVLNASALSAFGVNGSDMAGITVTATRVSGAVTTQTWANLGGTSGGVGNLTDVTLGLTGDTFTGRWVLVNRRADALVSIAINGVPGRITFDTGIAPKATNSATGRSLTINVGSGFNIKAAYSHKVRIGGELNEDQYACLSLLFETPLPNAGRVEFSADTDKLADGVDFELCA